MAAYFTNKEVSIASLPQYEQVNFHPISKNQRSKALTILLISFLFLLLPFIIFNQLILSDPLATFVSVFTLLFIAFKCVDVILKQSKYGYALREKDALFRRGYITTVTTIIPFSRIQHMAINQSLFDKLYGISTLKIYTAGGSSSDIAIPGLSPKIANSLKDAISKQVDSNDREAI